MEEWISATVGLIIAIVGGLVIGAAFIFFSMREPQQLASILSMASGK